MFLPPLAPIFLHMATCSLLHQKFRSSCAAKTISSTPLFCHFAQNHVPMYHRLVVFSITLNALSFELQKTSMAAYSLFLYACVVGESASMIVPVITNQAISVNEAHKPSKSCLDA